MSEQPETNTTSKKNPSPTGQPTSPAPHIDTAGILNLIHSAAKAARLRIVDGRAREAMALFEHELRFRIDAYIKEQK